MDSAEHLAGCRELLRFGEARDAKIRDDRASRRSLDEDILGLDVAVDDAACMGIPEGERHVAKLADRLRERWLATLDQPRSLDLTEERNPLLERVAFNVQVQTTSPILVDNNLARAEVRTNLRVLGSPYETGLTGTLTVAEGGEITLNERRYEVERATITFLEERRIAPSFDLRLNTSASSYDVTLAVIDLDA